MREAHDAARGDSPENGPVAERRKLHRTFINVASTLHVVRRESTNFLELNGMVVRCAHMGAFSFAVYSVWALGRASVECMKKICALFMHWAWCQTADCAREECGYTNEENLGKSGLPEKKGWEYGTICGGEDVGISIASSLRGDGGEGCRCADGGFAFCRHRGFYECRGQYMAQ